MGLARKKRGKVAPEMNVTPLVDVVLVLLIIFMVVLPVAVSDLNLELAKLENPDEQRDDEEDPYVLSVDADGILYFDDYIVERDSLAGHLQNAAAADPNKKLVLVGFPGVNLRATKAALDDAAAFAKSVRATGGDS